MRQAWAQLWQRLSLLQQFLVLSTVASLLILQGSWSLTQAWGLHRPPAERALSQPVLDFLELAAPQHSCFFQVQTLVPLRVQLYIEGDLQPVHQLGQAVRHLLALDSSAQEQLEIISGPLPELSRRQNLSIAAVTLSLAYIGVLLALVKANLLFRPGALSCRSRLRFKWMRSLLARASVSAGLLCLLSAPWARQHPWSWSLISLASFVIWKACRPSRSELPTIENGLRDAAVVMRNFPPEVAAQILKFLSPEMILPLTQEIAKLPPLSETEKAASLARFEAYLEVACEKSCRNVECPPSRERIATVVRIFMLAPSPASGCTRTGTRPMRSSHSACWGWAGLASMALLGALGLYVNHRIAAASCSQRLTQSLRSQLAWERLEAIVLESGGRRGAAVVISDLSEEQVQRRLPLLQQALGAYQLSKDTTWIGRVSRRSCDGGWASWAGFLLLGGAAWALRSLPGSGMKAPSLASPSEPTQAATQFSPWALALGSRLSGCLPAGELEHALERELGLTLPPIVVRIDARLQPDSYVILVREVEVAVGSLQADQLLCQGRSDRLERIEGPRCRDAQGVPGCWIAPQQRAQAEELGLKLSSCQEVLRSHLIWTARAHAGQLFSFESFHQLVAQPHLLALRQRLEGRVDWLKVCKALRLLLAEQVPIRDLETLLEVAWEHHSASPEELCEAMRSSLAPTICRIWVGDSKVEPIFLDPQEGEFCGEAAVDPLLRRLTNLMEQGRTPLVIVSASQRRRTVHRVRSAPAPVAVLSRSEVACSGAIWPEGRGW